MGGEIKIRPIMGEGGEGSPKFSKEYDFSGETFSRDVILKYSPKNLTQKYLPHIIKSKIWPLHQNVGQISIFAGVPGLVNGVVSGVVAPQKDKHAPNAMLYQIY